MSAVTNVPNQATPSESVLLPVRARRVTSGRVISNLILLIIGVVFVAPLVWLVFSSMDANAGPTVQWPALTVANFKAAGSSARMLALANSFYISTIATLVSTVPAALAGYAFARRHIPWKGPLLLGILMLAGVPVAILLVPLFQVYAQRNLLSLVPAAIFLGVTSLPFEIWIITNFIAAVPEELEEAARVEGAGTIPVLLRVVLPLALPGIGAAALFGFINAWGNFMVPLVLISSTAQAPAPVAMYSFTGGQVMRYGPMAAYMVMYSVPVVALYLAMARLFQGGFVLGGAVKG